MLPDCRVRDQLVAVGGLAPGATVQQAAALSGTSGWVVETVPLALFAAWHMGEGDFASTLDALVAVGGDTDSTAAIAGQVAGARLGVSNLPTELLRHLPESDSISATAGSFAEIAVG
jgi:ADP-ribosyl-[dinitrogen reductase] hydrolase